MTSIVQLIRYYYKLLEEDLPDPRTTNWFLIESIWVPLTIVAVYVYFVFFLGPALMKKRKPYNLRKVMLVYNILQILLNAFVAYEALRLAWIWKYKFVCEPVSYGNTPEEIQVASRVWLYYLIKILDLLDTVFFVLRKKTNQVTFLHVYHHAGMIIVTYIGAKYLSSGHGTLIGLVNAIVHVVMYTHYLLTTLNMGKPWWKKYITQIQLGQFYLISTHSVLGLITKDCGFPKWAIAIFLPQNLFMMLLFTDFYYTTYMKKKPSKVVNTNGVSNTIESKEENGELPNGKSKTY